MSQTKYPMPDDVKIACISYVRGYERRRVLYCRRRTDVLYGSGGSFETYDGEDEQGRPETRRMYIPHIAGGKIGRPVEDRQARLDAIERLMDTKLMRAVEQSLVCIGDDLADAHRKILRDWIMESCTAGKKGFRFEKNILPLEKTDFYERRRGFLHDIAERTGLL